MSDDNGRQEWERKRDALRAQFPVGVRVETVPDCFALESADGLSFVDNHDGSGPVRGIVTGHSANRVEFRDDDGTLWTMQAGSLRIMG